MLRRSGPFRAFICVLVCGLLASMVATSCMGAIDISLPDALAILTNHLDIKHQLQTLAIARDLGVSCLAALHDLAMASRFVDRVCLMKAGSVVASGPVEEVVTSERIHEVYDVETRVTPAGPAGDDWDGGLTVAYRYPQRVR